MADKRWDEKDGPIAPELGFDNYTMVVSKANFVIDPKYMQGEYILLSLKGRSPDISPEYADRDVRVPVGKIAELKVDSADPDHITKIDGGNITQFPARGLYSEMIRRALGQWNLRDALKDSGKWFDQASIWEGLRFRFTKETFEYKGKNPFTSERVFPTDYLGTGEKVDVSNNGASTVGLDAQLTALYDQASGHEMFVAFATALPAVKDNADVLAAVADPAEAEKRWGAKQEEVTA